MRLVSFIEHLLYIRCVFYFLWQFGLIFRMIIAYDICFKFDFGTRLRDRPN